LDTNILFYSIDSSDLRKQEKARELIKSLILDKRAVISTQVLQELYNVCTVKYKADKTATLHLIQNFSNMRTIQITPALIINAINTNIKTQFSFWDSLILAAANEAECTTLYSEDLNNGQVVNGVTIVNPFTNTL
jgi:predicted nucleic acid-binding protein